MCIRDSTKTQRRILGLLFGSPERSHYGNEIVRAARVGIGAVSYTHLRAHETVLDLVCRLLLEKKKQHPTTHTLIVTKS